MKRSALLLISALVAMFSFAPDAASGQTRRSLTDASEATRWLANDALTFARDVYEVIRPAMSDTAIRLAQLDRPSESAPHPTTNADASGCGWSCYPQDYGCFSYDYAYRAPVFSPLAVNHSDIDDQRFTCGVWRAKSTALIELPSNDYPCMNGDTAIHNDADEYDFQSRLQSLLEKTLADAQSLTRDSLIECKAQFADAGRRALSVAQLAMQWFEDCRSGIEESERLIIRPLVDIDTSPDDSNLLRFVASNSELDQEWQVAMDYFAEYGCPDGVWDDQEPQQLVSIEDRPVSVLNYWVARLTARAAVFVLARSSWANTAGDVIALVRTKHEEMLAMAEPVVPGIPVQEYMLDESTYVLIDDGQPYWSYDRDDYEVASGASIHSLSQAVLTAVRRTWTVHAMAAGETHTKR